MAELEESVERLESDLVEIKTDIKSLLIELKVLVARNQSPLADTSGEQSGQARSSPVIVVAPTTVF